MNSKNLVITLLIYIILQLGHAEFFCSTLCDSCGGVEYYKCTSCTNGFSPINTSEQFSCISQNNSLI